MNQKSKYPIKKTREMSSERIKIAPSSVKSVISGSYSNELKQKIPNEEYFYKLKAQIEHEWENKSIPGYLREVYRSFILNLSLKKAIGFMVNEISDLKSNNSIAQICLKGINAREESLKSIKEMNDFLSRAIGWADMIDIKLECAEILHAHRMLTLNVTETIERWRDFFMFELNDFNPGFIYNGENYIEKLKTDLNFLKISELSKVFKFSSDSDPFLIFPSRLIEKKTGKAGNSNYFMHNGEVIIPLPSIIVKRVQRMELFLKSNENFTEISPGKLRNSSKSISPKPLNKSTAVQVKQTDIIAKSILENMYREEVAFEINLAISSQINDSIAKQIDLNLDQLLEPMLKKIAENCIAEAIGKNNEIDAYYQIKKDKAGRDLKFQDETEEEINIQDRERKKDNEKKKEMEKKSKQEDEERVNRIIENSKKIGIINPQSKIATNEEIKKKDYLIVEDKSAIKYDKEIENKRNRLKDVAGNNKKDESIGMQEKEFLESNKIANSKQNQFEGIIKENEKSEQAVINSKNAAKFDRKFQENKNLTKDITEESLNYVGSITQAKDMHKSDIEIQEKQNLTEKIIKEKKISEQYTGQAKNAFKSDRKAQEKQNIVEKNIKESKNPEQHISQTKSSPDSLSEISKMKNKVEELINENNKFIKANAIFQSDKIIYEKQNEIEEASSRNAKNLQNSQICENLLRNFIEEIMNQEDLELLVENIIKESIKNESKAAKPEEKRRLTQVYKHIEEEKLQELLYCSIIEEFIEDNWLKTLVSSLLSNNERRQTLNPLGYSNLILEEAEDYVHEIFTPGVHSPNEIKSFNEYANKDLDELSIKSNGFQNLIISEVKIKGDYELISMNNDSKNIKKSIEIYFARIGSFFINYVLNIDDILQSTRKGEDSCWYWFKDSIEIVGCLIFSTFKSGIHKIAVIHHISTVSLELFPCLIKKTIEMLMNFNFFQTFLQYKISPSFEMQNYYKEYDPKGSNNHSLLDQHYLIELTIPIKSNNSQQKIESSESTFFISSQIIITTITEKVPINNSTKPEMIQIGNRLCLLNSILQVFNDISFEDILMPSMPTIRLQRDILELLEIITSMDRIEYPHISNTIINASPSSTSFSSLFEINLQWQGSSYLPYQIGSDTYKYIKLTNSILKKGEDNCLLYTVLTDITGITVFFLVYPNISKELHTELKAYKTDLFHKVDNILKSTSGEDINGELLVPGFIKSIEWDMCWMHGFEIPKQMAEENNRYVHSSNEKVFIHMDYPIQAGDSVKYNTKRLITSEFVFGIKHDIIETQLEIPIFVCLVQPNDWIKC